MKVRSSSRPAKASRPLRGSIAALLALSALVPGVQAGQIWDGGGANGLWSNNLNWDADTAPNYTLRLQFAGVLQLASSNDATGVVGGIAFNAGAGPFTLSGNAITLTGATIVTGNITNNSANLQTVSFGTTGITLGVSQTFNAGAVAGGGLAVTSAVVLGTNTLSVTGTNNTTLSGAITGTTGALTKNGTGTLLLSGTSSYAGQTTVNTGTVKAGSTTAFAPGSAFVVEGTLDLAGFSNEVGSLAGTSGGIVENVGATPATLTLGGNNIGATFAGLIRNGGGGSALSIRKIGTGAETFSGANTYTGGTTLENGSLFADNNTALGTGTLTITSAGGPTTLGSHNTNTALANPVSVQSDFSIMSPGSPGDFYLDGPVNLNGATRVITGVTNQAQIHFGGVISNGALTLTTAGLPAPVGGINPYVAFIYDGAAEHAYTGLTTVQANAFLVLQSAVEKLRGDVLIEGQGVVDYLGFPNQLSDTTAVTVNSPGSTIVGLTRFAGLELRNFDDTIGALFGSAVGTVGLGSAVLTVGRGDFSGVIKDGDFGVGGVLTKNTAGTLTLRGTNTYTGNTNINNGTLVLDGSVQSPTVFVNFSGTLMGTGTAAHNLINAGVFSPGNSPGTFHIGGNFLQTGAGTTVIEVGGKNPGEHDLITVGGRASLDGSLRIVKLGKARLKVGDKVTFLTAQGGVSGQFQNVDNDFATGSIITAGVVYGANDVSLQFQQGSFAGLSSLIRLTPNQKSVAAALDRAVSTRGERRLIDFLNARPLDKLPHDFDLIAPEELQSVYSIGFSQANVQTANLQRRMDDVRSGIHGFSAEGLSVSGTGEQAHAAALAGLNGPTGTGGKELRAPEAAPAAPADRRFGTFITGVGEFSRVGDTGNARGYDLASGGFTLGGDYRVTESLTVGVNTGYARSGADLGGGGRVTVDGAKLGAYATWFNEGLYVDAAVQGGYNSYTTRRSALRGNATGSTTGGEVNALLATGFDFTTDALRIGPTVSFQYTHIGFSGFRESGSLAPLTFGSQASDSTRSAIGLKAAYEFRLASGVVVRPEGRLAWQHEFGDIAYALDSRLANGGGKVFTVQGSEIGRDSALLGLGVSVLWSEHTAAYLFYDGEIGRANYSSSNVSGGVRMTF